ncbi:MAG TPA: proline--tRNA ligase [Syntrophorhabdaceae bacterium]|mgnify:CR=1 FL=1|nr:proline--tRNA ligase [Syntrophorhabdaceae bacterium]
MRFSKMFIPTVKEDPKEAEVISHRLMLRAGFIRRLASGIYTWLPLGLKSLKKVETIIREEMNKKGAQEILMPFVQPKELWEESTRWEKYGKELLRFYDRNNRELCLGPTHEEVVTDLVRKEVRSYRELPLNLYQIQTKFRDEIRPRFGVMRAREFVMKDAYSFDVDEEGAEKSYMDMYDAYTNIFKRCGFRFRIVEADTGQIGGSFSHEFMVLAETGEDIIIYCDSCGYAANLERAEVGYQQDKEISAKKGYYKKVETPNKKRIEEVSSFLNIPPQLLVKTIIYNTDRGVIGVLVRGDRDINETKIKNILSLEYIELADEATIEKVTGGPLGFSGPIGLKIPLYADRDILYMEDFVVGGNEKDMHIINANISDFNVEAFFDLKIAKDGDLCPRCKATLNSTKGIEVGHIFKLGLKYSKAMGAKFLDKNGEEKYMVMGCYGIGVSRIIAAAIEQANDENGMILPCSIAPFEVDVLPVNSSHRDSMELAERIYKDLLAKRIDALIDDRDVRPGVKFKDCDLMGIPLRITIGEKNLKDGFVEIKHRDKKESLKIKKEDIVGRTIEHVEELKRW